MDASRESPNLDFLRSAAVLFVVFFHVLMVLEQNHVVEKNNIGGLHAIGSWGVMIFFVHTCLVLMISLERQHHRFPGEPAYFSFLVRRIFRVYPLSMFVVACVVICRIPVGDIIAGHFVPVAVTGSGVLDNLLLVQNLTRTPPVIVPLWTLPYEMQMYLFLPALYLFVRRKPGILWIAVLWLITFVAAIPAHHLDRLGFPNLVEFAPYFLSGVVAFRLTKMPRLYLPAWLWPVAMAGTTALFLSNPNPIRGWISSLLVAIIIPQFKEISATAARNVFKIVARYSYGIYLAHFVCIWVALQVCAPMPVWFQISVLFTTLTALPFVLYHLIEEPMIAVGARLAAGRSLAGLPAPQTAAV